MTATVQIVALKANFVLKNISSAHRAISLPVSGIVKTFLDLSGTVSVVTPPQHAEWSTLVAFSTLGAAIGSVIAACLLVIYTLETRKIRIASEEQIDQSPLCLAIRAGGPNEFAVIVRNRSSYNISGVSIQLTRCGILNMPEPIFGHADNDIVHVDEERGLILAKSEAYVGFWHPILERGNFTALVLMAWIDHRGRPHAIQRILIAPY